MHILITGAWQDAVSHIEEIESLGHNVTFMQYEKDPLPCASDTIDAVIGNGLFLFHDISTFTRLKYIQLTSAGFDRVPMEYVNNHDIVIYNARGVYSIPIAEYVICGVLQLYKRTSFYYENKKQHLWLKNRNVRELNSKTVCIVGCGSVGDECARRFKAFNCHLIGVDLKTCDRTLYDDYCHISSVDSVLKYVDVLVLTVPLTDRTRYLVDEAFIKKMKPTSIIVNVARGQIIKNQALIDNLMTQQLFGAVLDVFEDEPLDQNSMLWDLDNVVLTPHNSFVGEENNERLWRVIYNNLKDWHVV